MKRFTLAILSFLYLCSIAGANLHFHYCMGKLESWSIGATQNRECGNCGMDKKAAENTGCCTDEFKHIKLQVDQKTNSVLVFQFNSVESGSTLASIAYHDDLDKHQIFKTGLNDDPPATSFHSNLHTQPQFSNLILLSCAIAFFPGNHCYFDDLYIQFSFKLVPTCISFTNPRSY